MKKQLLLLIVFIGAVASSGLLAAEKKVHTFELGKTDFLLDNKPFQIISGEMHPSRIPAEYWRHRLQMAKAMGCNTIAAYVFWNYHESEEGKFDFSDGNHDIAGFIKTATAAGLWVLLRPGPYVCAEWDFGGLPPYLLKIPDIRVRCLDPRYMDAVGRYISQLAEVVRPLQVSRGGAILMLQIENEYGSYGNDRAYLEKLRELWQKNGIEVPFFTGDGPTPYMLEAGTLAGAAVGLDSGSEAKDFELAARIRPGVPVFSSETYPGWLTHWGEEWVRPDAEPLYREVKFLLANHKSFNFYVIHGGSNFGFTAGANSGGKGFEPDITSYDYDAPINEQGRPTKKFHALRRLLGSYLPKGKKLPPLPAPLPAIEIPEIQTRPFASIWNHLPQPLPAVQPKPMEAFGQYQGLILYRTRLIGHKGGKLTLTDLHDYALVFVDGKYVGKLDRREGEKTIELPRSESALPVLDLLVEAMGRINFAQHMIDRKGITERVTLNNMTLMNWEVFSLPLDAAFLKNLALDAKVEKNPGIFFQGFFKLKKTGDTFIDLSGFQKGVAWINGRNLGRYWHIGPQKRLFCPATWLKAGINEILIFDLHQTDPATVKGAPVME